MADINAIATEFTKFYYSTFDNNRAQLLSLYVRPDLSLHLLTEAQYPDRCRPYHSEQIPC